MNELLPSTLDPMAKRLRELAARGLYFGTSSWKYPGWMGTVYSRDRYVWRGRFSKARFERLCLAEYAESFPSVCVDAAYYTFPTVAGVRDLDGLVPDHFRFSFKVTGDITIRRFPALRRFGQRAGRVNEDFLNADLFAERFLAPCTTLGPKLGLLMFEFSEFPPGDFPSCDDFLGSLDRFLARLPEGVRYGVEIRNADFLTPAYFSMLNRHSIAHVFNSWSRMPPVQEQMSLPGSMSDSCLAARFLLKPGRAYADAVKRFSPYDELKEPYSEGIDAGARLAASASGARKPRPAFLYVNNRFEGNAPQTIRRMLDQLDRAPQPAGLEPDR